MSLTIEQLAEYDDRGVVVARGVLEQDHLQPVIEELREFVDSRARELKSAGKLEQLHEDEPFDRRFALLARQCGEMAQGMDIMHHRGPAMFEFLFNNNLLDAVESIVGPEITCSPIQHIRPKPPATSNGEGTGSFDVVPWHQDAGVMMEEAEETNIVTCWLPLVHVSREMGCLQVLPGVNRIGYVKHQAAGGTSVVPGQIPCMEPVDLECRPGDVIFMHRFIPHRSMPNLSDRCRWSIDLRYQTSAQHTGRTGHPAFVVRSVSDPGRVERDYDHWCERWVDAFANPRGFVGHRRDVE